MNDSSKEVKLCCDCHERPVKPQRNAKRPFYRCEECHRAHKREEMRRIRAKKQEQLMDDPVRKRKRCTKCKCLKPYSAFSPRANGKAEHPELNKMCDTCLTKAYSSKNGTGEGMTPEWWRTRAYNVNTMHRQRLAQLRGVPVADISTDDLDWICKPVHLLGLYEQQNHRCYYCGVELSRDNLSAEHKVPRTKGGAPTLDNLALCCSDCNYLKHTRTEEEFVTFLKEYATRIINRFKDKEP